MSLKCFFFLLSTLSMKVSHSQKFRFEDENITVSTNSEGEYRGQNEDSFEGEPRSFANEGAENVDLVSKQYYSRPNFPSSPNFQYQYNKFPNQNSWEWSSSPYAKKPTVQFPGESTPTSSPTKGKNTISTSGRKGTSAPSSIRIDENCHCGIIPMEKDRKKLQRIVGGTVSDNSWPWMVAIAFVGQTKPFWFCGGSLISDKFVLTAAHCLRTIRNYGLSNVKLIMGTNNLLDSKAAVYYSIRSVKPHPSYKSGTENYDMALLEIRETVNFTAKVAPICLTQDGEPFVNRTVTVTGWGSLQNGESPPADLREVDLRVVSSESCQKEYYQNYRTNITPAMLCAWFPKKDSCQGDSGGPLFLKTTTEPFAYTQVGIVSFGPPNCGATSIPGVYSRVASGVRWIKSVTKGTKFCKGSL